LTERNHQLHEERIWKEVGGDYLAYRVGYQTIGDENTVMVFKGNA